MEFFILLGIGYVIYKFYERSLEEKAKEEALRAYGASLAELKQNPIDPDIKQTTLALGRAYSNLTRDKKGHSVFDEVALMNDINAACAAATGSSNARPVAGFNVSVEARLRTLADLKEKGLIEQREYERRKNEILASV